MRRNQRKVNISIRFQNRGQMPWSIAGIIRDQFIDVLLLLRCPSAGPSGPFIILFPLASRVMRVANRRAWLADFWHGDRKWFTVGDASRGEAERGDTRSGNGEVVCGGGVLDSLQSHSLSLSRSISSLFSSCNIWSLPLSAFLSPRRGSRLKTRSKSRRRVASFRFRDSKEGSFLFPTRYRYLYLCRMLRLYFAYSHDDVAGASVIRRETPGPFSRTPALFWTRELFGSRIRVVLFHRRTYLVSSFLSFSDLSGDRPPCYILALRLTKSWKRAFSIRHPPRVHSVFSTRRNRNTAYDLQRGSEISAGFTTRIASYNNNFCWCWIKKFRYARTCTISLNIVLNLNRPSWFIINRSKKV